MYEKSLRTTGVGNNCQTALAKSVEYKIVMRIKNPIDLCYLFSYLYLNDIQSFVAVMNRY